MNNLKVTVSVAAIVAAFSGNSAALIAELENLPGTGDVEPIATGPGPVAPYAPSVSVADRVQEFLNNDTSVHDWRSAKALGLALGVPEGEVIAATRNNPTFKTRQSVRDLGTLITLAA